MQIHYAQTNLQLYNQMLAANYPDSTLLMVKQSYRLALDLFANRCRGNEKPFICHLIGTASILVSCAAESTVVIAGLLHAVYAQGEFGDGCKSMSAHHRLRFTETVGSEIEELITAYTKLSMQKPVLKALLENQQVYNEQTEKLILIRIANVLEDISDAGTRFCSKDKYRKDPELVTTMANLAHKIEQPELASTLLQVFADTEAEKIPGFLVCTTANSFNHKKSTSSYRRVILNLFRRFGKHG